MFGFALEKPNELRHFVAYDLCGRKGHTSAKCSINPNRQPAGFVTNKKRFQS